MALSACGELDFENVLRTCMLDTVSLGTNRRMTDNEAEEDVLKLHARIVHLQSVYRSTSRELEIFNRACLH